MSSTLLEHGAPRPAGPPTCQGGPRGGPRCAYWAVGEAGRPSIRVLAVGCTVDAAQHEIRRGGGASLVTIVRATSAAKRASPLFSWLRHDPRHARLRRDARRAVETTVSSRHIANRIRLRRRARPTTAMRRPAPARPTARPSARSARAPCAAPTGPRRLHQQAAELARPRFRDVPAMAALGRTVFARHEAERGTHLRRPTESARRHRSCARNVSATTGPRPGPSATAARPDRSPACAREPRIERGDLGRQRRDRPRAAAPPSPPASPGSVEPRRAARGTRSLLPAARR